MPSDFGDSLSNAQERLGEALTVMRRKMETQQHQLNGLTDENAHLRNLLETRVEQVSPSDNSDHEAELERLNQEIAELREQKLTIKKRLDSAISGIETALEEEAARLAGE
ncbi:hypothetical protein QGN29_06450 [Temperatibacter marinus]|uniref:Uncharacterized protein n=1 Tax=Temperatibacter marinus TaxID=1456591 RepID=A0AA52HAJ0_9PROT|nr:hypothetical protein [Temperatibacter marinus]WND04014.1 hypothetical protein QGN29_06450 [Temperatibacter marinus]